MRKLWKWLSESPAPPHFSFEERTIYCRTRHIQFSYRAPDSRKDYGAPQVRAEGQPGWMTYKLLSSKYDDLNLLGDVGSRIPISGNDPETGFEKVIEDLRSSYNLFQQSAKPIEEIATEIDEKLLQIIKKFDAQVPIP